MEKEIFATSTQLTCGHFPERSESGNVFQAMRSNRQKSKCHTAKMPSQGEQLNRRLLKKLLPVGGDRAKFTFFSRGFLKPPMVSMTIWKIKNEIHLGLRRGSQSGLEGLRPSPSQSLIKHSI